MNTKTIPTLALVAATMTFIQSLSEGLPMLEQPWLGFFAVADEDGYRFQMGARGESAILILNSEGSPLEGYPIALQFLATETLPDGTIRELPLNLDTLASADPPTAKLKKTVFSGKLTDQAEGQPTLEVTIEHASGSILASARITDKGAFDKNPLQPVVKAVFPGFYANEQVGRETWDKKQVRDFDKMLAKDSVSLKRRDGKTVKLSCVGKSELKSEEINAAGSSTAEVEIAAYQGRKIGFLAAPDSAVYLHGGVTAPLHGGFVVQWHADTAKDPDGKAKLAIRIK